MDKLTEKELYIIRELLRREIKRLNEKNDPEGYEISAELSKIINKLDSKGA